MKKKLIQILMLLVAAVSVGSFVSCKDTNEDLYNELRTQVIDKNASLQDAIDKQQAALEDLLQKYKDLLATVSAINSCDCDEAAMQTEINDLKTKVAALRTELDATKTDVSGINTALTTLENLLNSLSTDLNGVKGDVSGLKADFAGLSSSFTSEIAGIKNLITLLQTALTDKVDQATLTAIINGLTTQISGIQAGLKALEDQNLLTLITQNKALQDGLETRIATLESQLAAIKSCNCDYTDKFNNYDSKFDDILTRLAKAEQAIIDNKNWMDQQLADIRGDVTTAQTTANNALALANTANTNAQLALSEAQRIEGLANAAQQAADKAQGDATAAQQAAQAAQNAADLAYALAAQAFNTANKVNDLAVTVASLTGRVEANEQAITKLQQDTKDLRDLIDANEDKLQAAIDKVNGELSDKIDAIGGRIDNLKDDINDKLDALKDQFQGKIDDLDNKLEDKIYEVLGKISELNSSVLANAADIKTNAQAIATNAQNIKANADAIEKIQDELKTINTNLTLATEKANQAYNEASEAKAKAEANEQSISDLKVAVGTNEANIKNLETTTNELKDAIKDLQDKAAQIGLNTQAIENLTKTVDDLNDDLEDLSEKFDNLKDQLTDLAVELATVKQECKDNFDKAKAYVDTEIANLKAGVIQMIADELKNYYDKDAIDAMLKDFVTKDALNGTATQEDLNQFTKDFYDKIIQLYKDMAAGDQAVGDKLYELAQRVAANEQHLEDIDKVLQTMDEKFKDYVNRETLIAWYWQLMNRIHAVDGRIDGLKDELKNELVNYINVDLINDIKDQLPDLIKDVIGDASNFVTKDDLEDLVNDLIEDKVDAKDFADALEDLAALKARVKALEEGTVKIGDYNVDKTALWKAINDNFKTLDDKVGDVQDAVDVINGKLPTMENDIKTLKNDMKDAKDRLDAVEPKVDALRNDVTALQNYLGSMVTGITIQGTYNPMFGTFSIPANIQSNVLVAYYGEPVVDVEFPTIKTATYIRSEEALTPADWSMITASGFGSDDVFEADAGLPLMNGLNSDMDGKAPAGKVYLTINPTTVDVKGLNLTIVNSQDQESLFKLEPLRKSNATLQFGYSRADNGFYEADAYVMNTSLKDVERPFNEAAIKDLAKDAKEQLQDIINGKLAAGNTGLDVLAADIYDVIRTLRLQQSGLKCEYTSPDGTSTQSIYSQYNLAATALKPLGLNWGKDFNYVTVPGYERVESLLNKLASELKKKFKIALNTGTGMIKDIVDGIDITKIELKDLKDETVARFEITIGDDVTIDGLTYHMQIPEGAIVPVKFAKGLTVNGTAVNIPSGLMIDEADPDANAATLVICGNVTSTSVPMKLVIPVVNDAIKKYVWYDLEDQVPASMSTSGVLTVDAQSIVTFVATGTGYTITPATTAAITLSSIIDLSSGTTPTLHLSFTYDLRTEMAEVWGNSQDAVNNVREMLEKLIKDINNTLDRINNYENKFNNIVDSYLGTDGKLHQYLDKINTVIVNFINGINYQLGPFMVTEDAKGFKVISPAKDKPTVMEKNDLKIYPTSKTLEIVVPFSRKHVAVTNVYKGSASAQGGDADCVAKLKAANKGDMNTVIDGTQRMIEVSGMESGYIYEIAYSALDFRGNISTRRGYIQIK